VRLGGDGTCPSPALVAGALRAIAPRHEVTLDEAVMAGDLSVRVRDREEGFELRVGERGRTIRDPQRHCAERARTAALIIALALEPPFVALPQPPGRPPAPAAPRALRADLEVGAAFDVSPGVERQSGSLAAGVAIRGAVGLSWIKGVLGLGLVSPLTLDLGVARARLWRLPLDLALRVATQWRFLEISGELGLAMDIVMASGEEIAASRSGTRLELGFRAAATLAVRPWGRWGLFASPCFTFIPSPSELQTQPQGVVGTTPRLRTGALVGLTVRLD
jgi:hypothetical protein